MYDLVIQEGTVVTPQGSFQADVACSDGRIAALGMDLQGETTINAEGRYLLPGVVDSHTHMSLHLPATTSSDDFHTGTKAAACGGVTTIIDFTGGAPERPLAEDIANRRREAEPAVVDYAFHAEMIGWRAGEEAQIRAAVREGVTSFKFFTAYGASGRRSDNGVLYHAMKEIADLDALAVVHAEDDAIIASLEGALSEEGKGRMEALADTRPDFCEASAIGQVAFLAELTGARTHIVHVSSGLGAEQVMAARERGAPVTGETCPQYLLLTEECYRRPRGHRYAASPALRTPVDQEDLWESLREGILQTVVTDHCPFTNAQKEWKGDFRKLPYGLPGVETLLPLVYSEGVTTGRITLEQMTALLSANTARIFGLSPRKGAIQPGSDADLVIFDPRAAWTVTADSLHMHTDFSPYEGHRVQGAVETTISRGEVIYSDGSCIAERGRGRFLHRR
ncbi:MAG: dihydropyrimidinase [Synergistales bacterium]|nr:dihydropyrimidinase [Synergistales bacterium]